MYEITTEKFSGPLDLLLQLVEKNNLEITEISLANVTQDYLNYIQDQNFISPDEIADFLVIASTLLLIKSKSLLPSLKLNSEEEEEILDLENRLQMYKIYKELGIKLQGLFRAHNYLFTRVPWKDMEIKFSPPPNFSVSQFSVCFKKIMQNFEGEIPLTEKKITKMITLKQRIQQIIQILTKGKKYNLEELVSDKNKKIELIMTFLAILYLAKENLIRIKQEKNFGSISIWISNP